MIESNLKANRNLTCDQAFFFFEREKSKYREGRYDRRLSQPWIAVYNIFFVCGPAMHGSCGDAYRRSSQRCSRCA